MWYVYILKCSDDTFYTGITKDLEKRLKEHNSSKLGAKYTQGRRPVSLIYSAEQKDRSTALKEEYRIKSLTREKKLQLVEQKD
jgi:putative endonuclease